MHLLRWTAIRGARDDGAPSIDLGGVDVRGARRQPQPGEPAYGMFEHKIGFGARWVESAAAHEVVLRPSVYRADLALRRLRRRMRGLAPR
jgi:lipid II:glycine glycyltransferase (peptidoglycan interpeptide bridge formation enzyme)